MSSNLIKEKYLGYILSIFMCFCSFGLIQENYPYDVKVNNFGSYPLLTPLDQANFICFDVCQEEKYLGYNLSIFMFCCCFQFFQENYPCAVKVNNFGSYTVYII